MEKEKQEEQAPPEEAANRKAIWQVSYESGSVLGCYEGTPAKIAAFLIGTDPEGRFIKKLHFQALAVKKVPEVLMRDLCCGKKYTLKDNFCSRCGKALAINNRLPAKFKMVIEA
ncbi:MAG: hypothetical protein RDV48_12940 [Candidatus Eremiobacteraeota bacterium]|nr:hypothetical protein [Candidatus Eremiobacteraeota bacterium]